MCLIKLSKTPCPNLEQQYKDETGRNALYGDDPTSPPSLLYIEWLETKLNMEQYIATGKIEEVQKMLSKYKQLLSNRLRDIEMKKRLANNPSTTCSDCEYGKFHPCNYKRWDFETRSDDPSCENFTKWGCVL